MPKSEAQQDGNMPIIRITDEVYALVRKNAKYDWVETGTRLPNGQWDIPISDRTLKGLTVHLLFGESMNDCILRLFSARN